MSKLNIIVEETIEKVKAQLPGRAVKVSNVLRNSVYHVMSGGDVSAPGEPPGVRTGNYRSSFRSSTENNGTSYTARVESDCIYGPYLEYGTSKMAPRPHCERILEDATPQALAIFSEPYV